MGGWLGYIVSIYSVDTGNGADGPSSGGKTELLEIEVFPWLQIMLVCFVFHVQCSMFNVQVSAKPCKGNRGNFFAYA
ncbi:hypothetical protein GIB67_033576 [Kingdonia uniflora]|uniref:Uncharacterized protein n=1 Tax=Kingdonia uniflora TaxID=39325 RepID=A0A7J7L6E4_9MAGN|nr:hypothetical protein GIB67_033576 [Kingdonia uniflora]